MNTIHVNTTSRLLNAVRQQVRPAAAPGSFADALAGAAAPSLEEYKESIAARVAQMPVHSTRTSDFFRIDISDAGYEAMQNDPEYESFVLDTVRSALAQPNPYRDMTGSATIFLRFGSEPKSFRMDSCGHGDSAMETMQNDTEKTWWEERQERHKKSMELDEKIAEIRRAARHEVSAKLQRGEPAAEVEMAAASEIMSLLLAELMQGLGS